MRERRFPIIFLASAAGLVSIILIWLTYYRNPVSPLKPVVNSQQAGRWTFNSLRDSRNLGLSDEQCDVRFTHCRLSASLANMYEAAFPKLYTELDRARDHLGVSSVRQDQVKIWAEDDPFPHGQVHVLIHNGQVSWTRKL
jgi:hypothetical protein